MTHVLNKWVNLYPLTQQNLGEDKGLDMFGYENHRNDISTIYYHRQSKSI